jgi:predicted transposase YdaD
LRSLLIEGESRTRLECSYDVFKLWEMDPAVALEMETPGIWAFAPLMAGKREELAVKSAEKIRAAPDSLISSEGKGELLFVMATLLDRVVEDAKMREQLKELLSGDTEIPFVDFLREQGWNKGRAQGKAEGKAEGVVEEARRAVLHALKCRFGPPSQDLVSRIEKISCVEKLEALLGQAILAPGLEAFLQSME